jgi:type III pantothenate kinase
VKNTYLVIDIGNTSTSLGLYRDGRVTRVGRIEKVVQTAGSIADALKAAAGSSRPAAVGIASVVPSLNQLWQTAVARHFSIDPLWIDHTVPHGVKITYPKPASIGADRIANAAGAVRKYGAPVIVADFGTAVTFDLVTKRDGYIGGIIAPGLPLMFDYLHERTAQLPRIGWGPVRTKIGKSTAEAMQLGAHWGYRGMVREILTELRKVPSLRRATICATGGFAGEVLRGVTPAPIVDPTLTLYGIGCILEKCT